METRSVELNICQTCNWDCPSCNRFCDIFHDTAVDTVMTVAEVSGILDEINNNNELRVGTFTIIGGEPTLHPDCEAICRLVCERMAGTSRRIVIATNNSRPGVVSRLRAIPGLNIRIDDVRGSSAKRDKHWNCYDLSNSHNGSGFDFRKCGWYKYGIGIYKHRGKVRWFHCCHAQFVARLLDVEDDVAAFSLHDLLANDRSAKYNGVICRHCVLEPQNRPTSHDFSTVSSEFAPGYARILQEAKALSRWHIGGFRLGGVYAVCYTGNTRRHAALMGELARVGIGDVQVMWGFPSPYRSFLLSNIPHVPLFDAKPGTWGATLAQYEAVKVAYERGQDRVLIVEDDARFIIDTASLGRRLQEAPPDWDILMLDHFSESYAASGPCNGWAAVSVANSSACYVLRRKAMERLITMYESAVSGRYASPVMRASDTFLNQAYLGRDIKIYCAVPNLAVQQSCGDASNCGNFAAAQYRRAGLDLTKYSVGLSSVGSGAATRTCGPAFPFDGVYAICHTGNMRRRDALMLELERVGLCAETVWDFPTPYKPFLLSRIPHEANLDRHPGTWGATLRHYAAIKIAYTRGQSSIIIVEDDCRFARDVDAVIRGLQAAPADWDILMLDSIYIDTDRMSGPVNGWAAVPVAKSAACYAIRRKAMEQLITMYESPVSGLYKSPVMRVCDNWFNARYTGRDIKLYVAVPNLAVQQDCHDRSSFGDSALRGYALAGIDRSAYAPFMSV